MKRRIGITLFGIAFAALVGSQVLSQEENAKEKPGEMDPNMAKMMAYATPGNHHATLNAFEGTWDCSIKFWQTPESEPMASTGVIIRQWTLGGRYLNESFKSLWMGQPFEGFGLMGYDNGAKNYFSIWTDTMSTGFHTERGTCDASGKMFTFYGENYDPLIGKKRWTKSTIKIINEKKHVMKMYQKTDTGTEFTSFEMISTRK